MGPGRHHAGRVSCADTADGNNGRLDGSGEIGQLFQSLGVAGVVFRAGWKDGPESHVIRAVRDAAPGFVEIPCGHADDPIGAEEISGKRNREVVLAEVYAVGFGGEGDIDSVVYNEGNAPPGTDVTHRSSGLDQIARVAGFLSVLHGVGAARDCQPGQIGVSVSGLQNGVRKNVEGADFFHPSPSRTKK